MGTRLKSARRYQAGKTTLKLRKMADEGIRAFRAGELLPAESIAMNMLELDSHSAGTDLILAMSQKTWACKKSPHTLQPDNSAG